MYLGNVKKAKNILSVEELSLAYRKSNMPDDLSHSPKIVDKLTMNFYPGKSYGIVGHTGCGKSTLLREISGLNRNMFQEGEITYPEGVRIATVFQQPLTAYNPLLSIRGHLVEAFGESHLNESQQNILNLLLKRYGLWPWGNDKLREKPQAFSIGQLQRIAWVMVIAGEPEILLLDEPFTHVGEDTARLLIEDMNQLKARGTIVIVASHLRKLIEEICDEVYLMEDGKLREFHGEGRLSLNRNVVDAEKVEVLVRIGNLSYSRENSRSVAADKLLENINLEIRKGEAVGVYGKSGAGKSTLGKIIAGRIREYDGEILYLNGDLKNDRKLRARLVQFLPQDPVGLFPPYMQVYKLIKEVKSIHHTSTAYENFIQDSFPIVAHIQELKPVEMSGGQRQVLLFYLALLVNPDLLIIDENFSAMDPDLQGQIWDILLKWMQKEESAILIISHQIEELQQMCNRTFSMENLQSV